LAVIPAGQREAGAYPGMTGLPRPPPHPDQVPLPTSHRHQPAERHSCRHTSPRGAPARGAGHLGARPRKWPAGLPASDQVRRDGAATIHRCNPRAGYVLVTGAAVSRGRLGGRRALGGGSRVVWFAPGRCFRGLIVRPQSRESRHVLVGEVPFQGCRVGRQRAEFGVWHGWQHRGYRGAAAVPQGAVCGRPGGLGTVRRQPAREAGLLVLNQPVDPLTRRDCGLVEGRRSGAVGDELDGQRCVARAGSGRGAGASVTGDRPRTRAAAAPMARGATSTRRE
jgi:hypothetical protein